MVYRASLLNSKRVCTTLPASAGLLCEAESRKEPFGRPAPDPGGGAWKIRPGPRHAEALLGRHQICRPQCLSPPTSRSSERRWPFSGQEWPGLAPSSKGEHVGHCCCTRTCGAMSALAAHLWAGVPSCDRRRHRKLRLKCFDHVGRDSALGPTAGSALSLVSSKGGSCAGHFSRRRQSGVESVAFKKQPVGCEHGSHNCEPAVEPLDHEASLPTLV